MKSIPRLPVIGVVAALLAVLVSGAKTLMTASGVLTITSRPEGADFELVSPANLTIREGRAPATLEGLAWGQYRVIFRQPGCVGQRYPVTVGLTASNVTSDLRLQVQAKQFTEQLDQQRTAIKLADRISREIGPRLLRDLATAALKNQSIKDLLAKHGYQVPEASEALVTDDKGHVLIAKNPDDPALSPWPPNVPLAPLAFTEPASVDWNAEAEQKWKERVTALRAKKNGRKRAVRESEKLQQLLSAMCVDVLNLAKTDAEAAAIAGKWKIQQYVLAAEPR